MIFENIIGYELSGTSSKKVFSFDPVKQTEIPGSFSPATIQEVNLALQKAISAWRIYRKMTDEKRSSFLLAIADGIEVLDEILVNKVIQETGYTQARVLVERRRTVQQLRMFSDLILQGNWREVTHDRAIPGRMPSPKPDLRKMNMAIGPVVVFTASNFPLAYSTIGGDSVSALAAGCPVIVKAHESHLGTNALVAEVILNAAKSTGMPDGVFSSLIGDGIVTGQQLVEHALTAAVGFTGSRKAGRALFDIGCKRQIPIPVFAEMGSVNPVFLLPGKIKADTVTLAETIADSMTMSVGQFCTNPGILVAIDNTATRNFLSHLSHALSAMEEAVMLNENIASNFHNGIIAVRNNPAVTFIQENSTTHKHKASPVLTTVTAENFLNNPDLQQEIFGPFSLVVLCTGRVEMLSVATAFDGQLTATIHCLDDEHGPASELMEVLVEKAGRIIFNGVPTGVEVCESMTHGGPYPASTDSRFTAVGHSAIQRWLRPVTYQNCPSELFPGE